MVLAWSVAAVLASCSSCAAIGWGSVDSAMVGRTFASAH